jgi:cytoplasmic iron level regulating protein YaaA (DUF328/UPF0246 family)
MYSKSSLFAKSFNFCKKRGNSIFILSAKYGFISPEEEIEPYELTLLKMTKFEKLKWGEEVAVKINLLNPSEVNFYSGIEYFKCVTPYLECKKVNFPWK